MNRRSLLLSVVLLAPFAAAQQQASGPLKLDVTVSDKSGYPVSGLTARDFIVLDNKISRPVTSFRVVNGRREPVEFIVVIDAVNLPFTAVTEAREQANRFFKSGDGIVAHPTTIAVVTDKGAKVEDGFTTDGKLLQEAVSKLNLGMRVINSNSGIEGQAEQTQTSVKALHQILGYAATLPGRKVIVWISPGWPLLSGPNTRLNPTQQQSIFRDVINFSQQLRQGRITLYDVNPLGAAEGILSTFSNYQTFLRGITAPKDVDIADVSLQVLSLQSGGMALTGSTDVAQQLRRVYDDVGSWYELTYDALPSDSSEQYHGIEVKINKKPDLTARTRSGYYIQP